MKQRFDSLPSRLRQCTELHEIADVPCLIVQKDKEPRPFLFWIHGRTADKELDPGRYLRCVRQGVNVCAVDLPGHGQRYEERLQQRDRIFDVIMQMASEIDAVLQGLREFGGFDLHSGSLGGMSAGGMAAITRLLQPHPFKVAVLEATGGAWEHLLGTPFFDGLSQEEFQAVNPMNNLDSWSDIPLIAFHSKHDSWIPFRTESDFVDAIRRRSSIPEKIELIAFDHTGAPDEHIGFGRESAFVKEMQVRFLTEHLSRAQEV